jgi:predicted nuclease of predicted toxin-antitoxin system
VTEAVQSIVVLLDEGTPVLAATAFLDRGYQVIYHSDVLESGAKDDVVVAIAMLNKAALIAVDLDMKRMVRRFGSPNNNEKFSKLDLIFVSCNETLAEKRLEHSMSFIENEWKVRCEKVSRRLWLDVGPHRLTSYR